MQIISLTVAFGLLERASAVIVDTDTANALLRPLLDTLRNDPENLFLSVTWEDEGQKYGMNFAEGDNQTVALNRSVLTLTDTEGEECNLILLAPMDAENPDESV